ISDVGLVPDPDRIVARFAGEFDKLMWLTLMSPWEEEDASPPPALSESPPARKKKAARAKAGPSSSAPAIKVPRRFRGL
ncbi:MAG: hypothetical protein C3F16_07450, partial [Betaproteobacteria bacterium]